jgi:hypothetical protein
LLLVWHIINSLTMCWTLNHQNIIEMAQGHISLSVSNMLPSLVITVFPLSNSQINLGDLGKEKV